MEKIFQWIQDQQIFQDIPEDALRLLLPSCHSRNLAANSMVMLEDQTSPAVCLIVSGTVKISLERSGRHTLLNICGPGEVLGEISLLDGRGHSADIKTLEDTVLLWISSQELLRCLGDQPKLGLNLARILTKRVRVATGRIEALTMLDVRGRVAHQLGIFADEYGVPSVIKGTEIPFCLTQTDLGALVGASRPKVNQVLASLRRAHIIDIDKQNHIHILDIARLIAQTQDGGMTLVRQP